MSQTDEKLNNFFKKAFDNIIYDFIGTIDENTLKEVFEDSYEQSTINKNAFENNIQYKGMIKMIDTINEIETKSKKIDNILTDSSHYLRGSQLIELNKTLNKQKRKLICNFHI